MADPFMEIRAMALLEFGCPPMPIANGQRAETGESAIINSHDLLAVFMAQAFKQQDSELNQSRRADQYKAELEYYSELLSCEDTVDSIYNVMSKYTKAYLAAYLMHPYCAQDVVVMNSDSISPMLLQEINRYYNAMRSVLEDVVEPTDARSLELVLRACRGVHNRRFAMEEQNTVESKFGKITDTDEGIEGSKAVGSKSSEK